MLNGNLQVSSMWRNLKINLNELQYNLFIQSIQFSFVSCKGKEFDNLQEWQVKYTWKITTLRY